MQYRAGFICFDEVLVELKALNRLTPLEETQTLNCLKVSGLERGLLINFGAERLSYKRLVFAHRAGARSTDVVIEYPQKIPALWAEVRMTHKPLRYLRTNRRYNGSDAPCVYC